MNTATKPITKSTEFNDIKARVGDVFQITLATDTQEMRHSVKLLGYFPNKTLMITAPVVNNSVLLLREGQSLMVRAFSGTAAYTFNCDIIKVCNSPFAYLHLSYPKIVQKVPIRSSARIGFNIIGVANNDTHGDNATDYPINITDISVTGAAMTASTPIGKKDDTLRITFHAHIRELTVRPTLKCIIRSLASTDDASSAIKYGLQFVDLETQDILILQSLVYQKILDEK